MKQQECAQEAIALLEPIPEDQFITDAFTDGEGACCARGHIARLLSNNPSDYSLFNCSANLNSNYIDRCIGADELVEANNYLGGIYTESTVKARVMHYLNNVLTGEVTV